MTATLSRKAGTEKEGPSSSSSSSLKEADAAAGTLPVPSSQQSKKQKEVATTTKRQKRAQINEKHAWPQHPKIQNAQQREKAYVRAAGLLLPPSSSKQQQQQHKGADDSNSNNVDTTEPSSSSLFTLEQNNFARQLGSADARTRHRTVLQLQAYLKARSNVTSTTSSAPPAGLSELDLLKLHKCLWYTLYLADRVPVQAEVSRHVTQLIWSVAGTLEEDEYAASAYLQLEEEQQQQQNDDDDENDDIDMDEEFDESNESDSDDSVTMEVIENTIVDANGSDSNDDEEDDDSSDVDLEDKQSALLQNDAEMDELEPDEESNEDEQEEDEKDYENVGHCRGAHLAALWVRTWLRTIVREWGQMDKYRIDKFYTCLRDTLAVVYEYMAARHWSTGIIHLFNDALYEEVLSQTPNGIRYHLIDVCLEELCKASQKAALPLTEATFVDVLEPFFAMTQTGAGGDDTVQARVVGNVLEKFLTHFSVYSDGYLNSVNNNDKEKAPNSKDSKLLVFDQVHVGTISQFIFQVASDDEGVAKDLYRKNLYAVHKMYVRRIHQLGEDKDVDMRSSSSMRDEIHHHHHHIHDENCSCEGDDDDDENDNLNFQVEENDDLDDINNDNVEKVDGIKDDNIDDNNDEEDSELSSDEDEPSEQPIAVENLKAKSGLVSKNDPMPKKTVQVESSKKVALSKDTDQVISSESSKKKRKKGKKKGKKDKSLTDSTEEHPSEEITITAADQQAARKALQSVKGDEKVAEEEIFTGGTKKRKQNAAQAKKDESEAAAQKRVKFGDMNRARSWQASMKALNELDVVSKLKGTPEKGILLNKGRKVVTKSNNNKAAKMGGRGKKTKDYF